MAKNSLKIAELKIKFLEYYRELPVLKLAAAKIGKSHDTIQRWKEADASFAFQIEEAKADWALSRSKGVKSEEWLLERVLRADFAPPKHDIDLTSNGETLPPMVVIDTKENG